MNIKNPKEKLDLASPYHDTCFPYKDNIKNFSPFTQKNQDGKVSLKKKL